MKTIGFNKAEEEELLTLLAAHPKWVQRISEATSFYMPDIDRPIDRVDTVMGRIHLINMGLGQPFGVTYIENL